MSDRYNIIVDHVDKVVHSMLVEVEIPYRIMHCALSRVFRILYHNSRLLSTRGSGFTKCVHGEQLGHEWKDVLY